MKKKNILVITTWFPNKYEKTKCIFVKNIIEAQVKDKNIKITVIVPRPYFPKLLSKFAPKHIQSYLNLDYYEKADGYEIYRPYYLKFPFLGKGIESCIFKLFINKIIKSNNLKIDAIHTHGLNLITYSAVSIGVNQNIPVFCHLHDSYIENLNKKMDSILKVVFEKATKLLAVSEFQKNTILKLYPNLNNIDVVYNGIDTNKFKVSTGVKNGRFIFIGNLIPTKGLDILIEAVKTLADKNIVIDVYGKGNHESEYISLIKKYKLESNFVFKGTVENTEIPNIVKNYEALILPTKYETFGIVLIESLASGVPVLASDLCAVPEIVKSEEYGMLFESKNSKELANCLQKFNLKKWDKAKISEYGKQFDLKKTANQINNLYKIELDKP